MLFDNKQMQILTSFQTFQKAKTQIMKKIILEQLLLRHFRKQNTANEELK